MERRNRDEVIVPREKWLLFLNHSFAWCKFNCGCVASEEKNAGGTPALPELAVAVDVD
jgi:hypothetical protein